MQKILQLHNATFAYLTTYVIDIVLLLSRVYVAWVFLKSGYLKITSWESTLFLFEYEYKVPLIDWQLAAYLGTIGEIIFPVLLILGVLTRVNAVGLFMVNAIAVVSYPALWEGGYYDHKYWGALLVLVILLGGGKFAIDKLCNIK